MAELQSIPCHTEESVYSVQEFIEKFKESRVEWLPPYLHGESGLEIAANLAEFKEFREQFFCLSNRDQMNVAMKGRNISALSTTAGCIRILSQTNRPVSDFVKLMEHITDDYSKILKGALKNKGPFYTALVKFDKAQLANDPLSKVVGNLGSLDLQMTMIEIMRELYADETIIEVIEAWAENPSTGHFYDFVLLTERWDEFREYPTTWAISMLRGSNG